MAKNTDGLYDERIDTFYFLAIHDPELFQEILETSAQPEMIFVNEMLMQAGEDD